MISLERYDFNLNILPPLNFDENKDVVSSEEKEEFHFIHQQNVEINTPTPSDLNQPSLNSGEGGDVFFSEEEQFEITRSYHFDPSPSLSVIEKYDAILNQKKKLFILNHKKEFEDTTFSLELARLGINFDVDEWINNMFDRKKRIRLIDVEKMVDSERMSERRRKESEYERWLSEQKEKFPNPLSMRLPALKCIKIYKNYVKEKRINRLMDMCSSLLDIRKLISTGLKIKKRWKEFVEMLTSCKPFLYGAAGFILKGCKGYSFGLINPTLNLSGTLNIGANEAKIKEIFQSLTQAINTLHEKVSKLNEKNQTGLQEDAESYRDKYFAALEENNALLKKTNAAQDKLIAEQEEGKALRDRNIELLEDAKKK
ncbi:hypothetical protein PNK_1690 [Candidatus Protochlamydia naegleriophila]|uniref:Uncharacterized protein n=1 Tax=Candidatus Protochlamydia naegleriophila TaxID=389348 RepID=A0A0U5ESS5_9BACT|nr:hypothetical protein [Candidatus Protochlamydia naegleriophila]CUI17299.1 hypothetical protein PNK_1690 [Candidatus Protochlamydia naegleriophila]